MTHSRNLVLTGFMGTGKSAVGREVAARLGRRFVDTDQMIEAYAGRSIPDIFERDGEAAFRSLEAEVCREISPARGLVVATGGWALGTPENRAAMESGGTVICLRADPATLNHRLGGAQGRPMLHDADWQLRLRALLSRRLPTYLSFPLQVNTSRMSVTETAGCVLALWEAFSCGDGPGDLPACLPVAVGDAGYSVLIGTGLLDRAGALVAAADRCTGVALITDDVVGSLYAARLLAALKGSGERPTTVDGLPEARVATMQAGEPHKTLDTVTRLYTHLLADGLDRGGMVLALGGGVVGDVAGFTAATYMRGVPFVQLPTTLLAMVDSSVGGKTGVDLPQGKNLVGAFKHPSLVIIDPSVLSTLPEAEVCAGLAEVVKAGVIGSPALFERLEQGRTDDMGWLIREAVAVKIAVVEEDPYERGRRAVLNLGHTFGHAFEMLSDFRLRHGEGVAMGMVVAARLAVNLGHCDAEMATRIETTLRRLGLPVRPPDHPPEAVYAAMASDKKKQGSRIRFVLPAAIGRVEMYDDVPKEAVLGVLGGSGGAAVHS